LDDLFDEHGAENVWFQQDGETAHTSRHSLGILREIFPGHVVSLLGDIGWPPRSPNLTMCNFFLLGYLKAQAYQHRPQTLEGLKEAITKEVAAIPPEMTRRAMENFKTALCILFKIKEINNLALFGFISFPSRGVLSAASCIY
jgi:hypothetical protein